MVLRKIAALLHKLAPRLQGGPFYCGLSMHAVTSRTSWYEVLPQGLGHSMGAIACVKFDLDLLQVAADRLFTDPECLCHFAVSGPGGDQTQDRDFARRQPSRRPYPHEIRVGQLLQAGVQCRLNFPLNGLARIANLFQRPPHMHHAEPGKPELRLVARPAQKLPPNRGCQNN